MHRDNCSRVLEVRTGVGCLLGTHSEVTSDREHQVGRLVNLIDQLHVQEDASVTGVVQRVVACSDDEASWCAAIPDVAIVHAATRTVIRADHCHSAPSEVLGAGFVHKLDSARVDLALGLVVLADLVDCDNLAVGFGACG